MEGGKTELNSAENKSSITVITEEVPVDDTPIGRVSHEQMFDSVTQSDVKYDEERPPWCTMIIENLSFILDRINSVDTVALRLYKKNILPEITLSSIVQNLKKNGPSSATDELLEFLYRDPDLSHHTMFYEILEETGQQELAQTLRDRTTEFSKQQRTSSYQNIVTLPNVVHLTDVIIAEELADGKNPVHIAVMFCSEAITRVLLEADLLTFLTILANKFILELEEEYTLRKTLKTSGKLDCIIQLNYYLERKSESKMNEVIQILRERPSTSNLAMLIKRVLLKCEDVAKQDTIIRTRQVRPQTMKSGFKKSFTGKLISLGRTKQEIDNNPGQEDLGNLAVRRLTACKKSDQQSWKTEIDLTIDPGSEVCAGFSTDTELDEECSSVDHLELEEKVRDIEDFKRFKILFDGATYYFPEENITVIIPPNSVDPAGKPRFGYLRAKDPPKELQPCVKSKVYEFLPSDLITNNRMTIVIPLFPAHSYDFKNMTLMYREIKDSEFVKAETIHENKPTWVIHRNVCYLFLSHFCEMCVIKSENSSVAEKIRLESMLFYQYNGNALELKTTFGCYNETSTCSRERVTEHYTTLGYKKAAEDEIILIEGEPLHVQPWFSNEEWKPAFHGDGKQMKGYSFFNMMCPCTTNKWPPQFSHKLKRRPDVKIQESVDVHLMHVNFETSLSCDETVLQNDDLNESVYQRQITFDMVHGAGKIKEIFYKHMSDEAKLECANRMGEIQKATELCGREFTDFLLHIFITGYQGSAEQIPVLSSLVTYLKRFPCLESVRHRLKYMKWKETIEMKLFRFCEEKEMESFQTYLTRANALTEEECHELEKYPDTFSRLVYLMRNVILHKPENYNKLRQFCQEKSNLKKYIMEDIFVTNDMITSDIKHNHLPNLCKKCLLCVANVTLDLQEVIPILAKVGRSFCSFLSYKIITKNAAQRIDRAGDDGEALRLIRQEFHDSLEPRKLDIVLEVLSKEDIGKKQHAEEIKQHYHQQIRKHQRCWKCMTED